jgi:hypothetical protein
MVFHFGVIFKGFINRVSIIVNAVGWADNPVIIIPVCEASLNNNN